MNSVMRLMCGSPCPLYAGRNAEGTTDGRSHDDDYFEDDPPDGFLFIFFRYIHIFSPHLYLLLQVIAKHVIVYRNYLLYIMKE